LTDFCQNCVRFFFKTTNVVFTRCKKGSEIQCLVNLDEILEKIARMDDDISKLLREMKDISVSFTPEDLVHNMASIGHIKTTETIPHRHT
jgi:hypothetical protein